MAEQRELFAEELGRLAAEGDTGEIALLLDSPYGAGVVDVVSSDGATALQIAVSRNNLDAARVLLSMGASPNLGNARGIAPLHMASSPEMIALLVDFGADVNLARDDGSTALHFTATSAVSAALLARGAGFRRNNGRSSPLHYANTAAHARVLLMHGAPFDEANGFGHTPMHLAASKGRWEVIWHLLLAGAPTDALDKTGFSPLTLARTVSDLPASADGADPSPARMQKTVELLEAWERKPSATHQRRHFSWAAQARLCRFPSEALQLATGLPEDVLDVVMVDLVTVPGLERDGAVGTRVPPWQARLRISQQGVFQPPLRRAPAGPVAGGWRWWSPPPSEVEAVGVDHAHAPYTYWLLAVGVPLVLLAGLYLASRSS